MFKILYYYYFLAYDRLFHDSYPYMSATFALSLSLALFINGFLNILLAHIYCYTLNIWAMTGMAFLVWMSCGVFLHRNQTANNITKQKPKFFGNHKLSILITCIFFIATLALFVWEPSYSEDIINKQCKVKYSTKTN